jgi:flagellar motor switch protein FliN/FliY
VDWRSSIKEEIPACDQKHPGNKTVHHATFLLSVIADTSAIAFFVDAWISEFRRAVEMFAGQAPEVRHSRNGTGEIPLGDSALWVSHSFVGDESFRAWVGALPATWESLGASLGAADAEALRSTFLEIVNQAQQGCADAVNLRLGRNFKCEGDGTWDELPFELNEVLMFDVELVGTGLPGLCFAIELRAPQVLICKPVDETQAAAVAGPPAAAQRNSASTFGSLLTVKLPVLVSVAQTRFALREVFETGPGSIIPLPKDVGAPVDLVVHGTTVARGEIVHVKGNYGFRVKEIVSWQDRLEMCRG